MAAFEFRQAEAIRDAFGRSRVRYLFIGKSAAILFGFPDTTQDADVYVANSAENCSRLVTALRELDFLLSESEEREILADKAIVQLKHGPFDLDVIFAPDGIEHFNDAWQRRVEIEGMPVCSLDDIIASKRATHRRKDLETLPRLEEFRVWLRNRDAL